MKNLKTIKDNRSGRSRMLFISVILVILFSLGGKAQSLENSLLWKIEGKGIQTSYLFGTFHLVPKDDFVMKRKVSEAFGNCSKLVLELKMDNPLMQLEMLTYMPMKDSMTIDRLLNSQEYMRLDRALKESVGMGIAMFNTYKPMLVGTFLIMSYVGGDPASFDLSLSAMAREKEMTIAGLETLKYQMQIFDQIPYADQAKDLMKMVDEKEQMQEIFDKMIASYKKEDINALYELTLEESQSVKVLEILLLRRNRDWISKMETHARQSPTFFGVGAAHLGGEEGLIRLLRKSGYTLTPLF